MNPTVSIIIPAFNSASFLPETLASVSAQTLADWECIVVDDGSADDTEKVVKEWMATDRRFFYIYQTNKGLSGARNSGLAHARGRFVQFLDADDVLLPRKLEKQVSGLLGAEQQGLAVSITDYSVGRSRNIHEPSEYYVSSAFYSDNYLEELITRWEASLSIPPHCFLFSSDLFLEKGLRFDTALRNHEDFECWLNVFRLGPSVFYLSEKLCIYRMTDGSMSKNMKAMGEGFLQVLNKHIASDLYSKAETRILRRKRRAILGSYRRFDLMSWKDRLLSINVLRKYYARRILQKLRMAD